MNPRHHGLGLRSLSRDIVLTLVRQVAIIAVGLITTILLARMLGPDGNGQYSVAILLPMMLSTFLSFGVPPANVYFVGRGDVSVRTALRTTLALWGAISVLGIVVAAAAIYFAHQRLFPGVPASLLWLSAVGFPIMLLRTFIASLLQALQDFRRYNKMMMAAPALTLVLLLLAVPVLHWGVAGALIALVVGNLGGLGIAAAVLRPHLRKPAAADVVPEAAPYKWQCLGYGWKAHLSNILTFFNYRADVFLLNYFMNPAAAGIYMIAVQIAERLWMLSEAANIVILPRLASLHSEENKRRRLTPLIARWILFTSVCGALVLLVIAGPAIRMLFGNRYAAASGALLWLLPGIVLGGAARVLANDIAARGRPELNLYAALVVVTVNIGCNILLIPRYGINGAAISTTISYALNSVIKIVMYSWLSGNRWAAPIIVPASDWAMLRTATVSWWNARQASGS